MQFFPTANVTDGNIVGFDVPMIDTLFFEVFKNAEQVLAKPMQQVDV